MTTAVLETNEKVTTRYYIYGKGVVTRQMLKRDARLNRRAQRRPGGLLAIRVFTVGHGVADIGLRLTSAKMKRGRYLTISGLTADGQPFTGSYVLKTGCGPIDVG